MMFLRFTDEEYMYKIMMSVAHTRGGGARGHVPLP